MKNILIISTSLRSNSNSDFMANQFARGAQDAGCNVEKISLQDKVIGFCRGCLACQTTRKCVIADDANQLAEKVKASDILVFATPVYYYGMSGQMKTLLDRLNPLFGTDYKFRDIYLLATAADEDAAAMDGTIAGLDGWISCFPEANLKKVICGTGVTGAGEIKDKDVLQQAYEIGRSIL